MGAPPKLFKVGEIMRHTKLSRQTIHNYTMLGLIKPAERTPSGHRLYGEEVFDRIRKIELLKLHHTLEEVRAMLQAEDEKKSETPQ
ncbi:MAG: MerR family transcriptional regulator [Planctomycetes bacterium]|nr:MerR family transcriptional regulator [Planctomycetota bacterium]